jgi:hypothetical protein
MKIPKDRGKFAINGAELPLHETFSELRRRWIERFSASSHALAEHLGVRPQSVAQWASGSDPTKRPPLWALAALADDLRIGLLLTGDGLAIVRRRRKDAGTKREASAEPDALPDEP